MWAKVVTHDLSNAEILAEQSLRAKWEANPITEIGNTEEFLKYVLSVLKADKQEGMQNNKQRPLSSSPPSLYHEEKILLVVPVSSLAGFLSQQQQQQETTTQKTQSRRGRRGSGWSGRGNSLATKRMERHLVRQAICTQ